MVQKISILRGINVGGKRKILMTDLKELFQSLGMENVLTYIQSGNVLFSTEEKQTNEEISQQIEEVITQKYGFQVPVITLDQEEWDNIILSNPFCKQEQQIPIKNLHITLFNKQPKDELIAEIPLESSMDKCIIKNKVAYLYIPEKYHQSKYSNSFFEKKLAVTATTRNWKTMTRIYELKK